MSYDLIIVSKSISQNLIDITNQCIASARQDGELNVIVVETGGVKVKYDANVMYYQGPFNYNRALNYGLTYAKGDIHILANNDIYFHKGWSQIGEQMKQYGFDSASALSNDPRQRAFKKEDAIYEGYNIGVHLTGWCIFVTKEAIQKIGPLDETFDFWYSDNVYADQLKAHGLHHGLFCNIQVDHLESKTLKTLPFRDQRRYSVNARNKYNLYAK
jgi:glycosyltransferase involved in cell wall biosynthesis